MKFPFSTHVFYAKLNIIVKRCSFIANIVFGCELQAHTSVGELQMLVSRSKKNSFVPVLFSTIFRTPYAL